jgi:dihydroneopterin aldolase
MNFTLQLNELVLNAKLGVYEWERAEMREFEVDVTAEIAANPAIQQDDLEATLNYETLETLLREHAASQEWQLIERLIESLARLALAHFPMIQKITLELYKPQALEYCDVSVKYSLKRD